MLLQVRKGNGRLEVRPITQDTVPITLLEAARTCQQTAQPKPGRLEML